MVQRLDHHPGASDQLDRRVHVRPTTLPPAAHETELVEDVGAGARRRHVLRPLHRAGDEDRPDRHQHQIVSTSNFVHFHSTSRYSITPTERSLLDRADHSIVDPDPFSIFLGGGGSRITRVGWERSDRPAGGLPP
jgi:hypothetical protein